MQKGCFERLLADVHPEVLQAFIFLAQQRYEFLKKLVAWSRSEHFLSRFCDVSSHLRDATGSSKQKKAKPKPGFSFSIQFNLEGETAAHWVPDNTS
jgi:hypothetical protein